MTSNSAAAQLAMQGAAVLTIAAFLAKILSAIYRVPLQNLVGNTGFYVYQQVYPIYGIGMTFALNGLPSFIGKQIALQDSSANQQKVAKRYGVISTVFALICFAIVYFGAVPIAQTMGDPALSPVIESVSFMFLLMPILLVSRGYLQGLNDMVPTAISQVVEQFVRVAVILLVAFIFARMQVNGQNPDVYKMGFWTMQSAWIAAGAASIVMIYYWLKSRDKIRYQDFLAGHYGLKQDQTGQGGQWTWGKLIKDFVTEGFVICFFSALLVFYQLIDALTVYDQLVENGMLVDLAKEVKGVYDRGQPIVQLGMVISTALATSFLPSLARAKNESGSTGKLFQGMANQYLRVTLLFSLLITGGLISIMPQLNHFLFASRDGSSVLMAYVFMVILASLVLAQNNILQAQNRWYLAGFAFVVGIVVKMALTPFLVARVDTLGAALATNIGLLTMVAFLEICMSKGIKVHTWGSVLFQGGLLAVAMVVLNTVVSMVWHDLLGIAPTRMMDAVLMFGQIAAGLCFAWLYLRKQAILTKEEWLSLPKGEKIWQLLQ